ncbi:hypothetical protein DFH08DRAFT_1085789 [Mycena albidolilacea]|uniref:F-box domain-containing protein n=1 Tax=Mycena albidolilacea TaxID=1033008 RepID=A0AAD6ZHQ4_9AGAR|nr:hypothetical protein DFH08DRAFT_1085789 [Mycena albidolilacea]
MDESSRQPQGPHSLHSSGSQSYSSPQEKRDALARVKTQIAVLKASFAALATLEIEEKALEASLAHVVYPVLALPVEITSRTFRFCLPAHGRVAPSARSAPLLLAQICQQWRDVALSTSQLWSSLYINGNRIPMSRVENIVRTRFYRARQTPLSVGLAFDRKLAPASLLELILSHAKQIRCLDLHVRAQQFCNIRAHFPILQHLATTHLSQDEVWCFLEHAPLVRGLRLLAEQSRDVSIPPFLYGLTRLEISRPISLETCLHILRTLPVLCEFKFSLHWQMHSVPDSLQAPVFPHLSSLTLGSEYSSSVLCLLTLPNLRFLKLPGYSTLEDVLEFVARSVCAIDHLVLCFEDIGEHEMWLWLEAFPTVSTLEITNCHELAGLLRCLDPKRSHRVMPRLTDVQVRSETHIDDEIPSANDHTNHTDAVVEMLQNRRDSASCALLRRFRLDLSVFTESPDTRLWSPGHLGVAALTSLIANGLDFVVQVESYDLNGSMTETWPQGYVPQDPLPLFP